MRYDTRCGTWTLTPTNTACVSHSYFLGSASKICTVHEAMAPRRQPAVSGLPHESGRNLVGLQRVPHLVSADDGNPLVAVERAERR